MDRSERIGLGVAIAGHALLFALLSARFFPVPIPTPVQQQPLEVSLVKDVALEAAAPKAVEPPAPSVAPDRGAPEDAAPPEPVEAPPAPEPKPAPPVAKPAPAKPKPVPPKPVEKPAPAPKPVAIAKPAPARKPKPEPAAPEKTVAKAQPAKSTPAKSSTKASAATTPAHARPAAAKGTGTDVAAKTSRPRGSLLGDDFLKGLSDKPAKSQSAAPVAAKIGAQDLANIGQSIKRQVQPCANQQHTPGPGAERILVTINLRLNRDGSLAGRPKVTGHDGVNDENQRYVARVDDLAIATYMGCSPLHGLPDALYDVQNGWSNFSIRYKLPG